MFTANNNAWLFTGEFQQNDNSSNWEIGLDDANLACQSYISTAWFLPSTQPVITGCKMADCTVHFATSSGVEQDVRLKVFKCL